MTPSTESIVESVRERYDQAAKGGGSCCGGGACGDTATTVALQIGYTKDELKIAQDANLGLGCGAPVALLDPKPGETVLDLGSGPGLDALLAARRVGEAGRVIGVDMTPSMIDRARGLAVRHGLKNVDFRDGRLEKLPVDDASVDAVTSNCVINLVPDKAAVFAEIARVLRPGGRLVVSDIVLDRPLPKVVEKDVIAWVGCVAGASLRTDYFRLLREAGLSEPEVLKDVDYVAAMYDVAPGEIDEVLLRTGVKMEDVAGSVRSLTYRARKAAR
jgi:arsenite methyltransferase